MLAVTLKAKVGEGEWYNTRDEREITALPCPEGVEENGT